MRLLYGVLGLVVGITGSFIFSQNHVDTMQKLTYNIAVDAYYVGCREQNGAPEECHDFSLSFASPLKWEE